MHKAGKIAHYGAEGMNESKQGVAEGKVKLYTDPGYFGAEIDDAGFDNLPIINISANQLVGFEPDSKMNQPKSRANVEKIVAGLKQGAKLPPILVRKYKNGYQVLDGHHRFWAYKLLGVKSIPSRIVPDEDIEEISKQGVAEGTDVDVGGIRLNVVADGAEVIIRPAVDGYQAGYAVFDRDGSTLVPADLAIDEEFRGRGIAKIIYDYVKSLGFAIRRSSDQTRAGKHFWDKNRGEDSQVWEQTMTLEELDEACWKGYHKEGNKKMFGKTYPNCVKNTKEDIEEDHRIARKPGQPANSKKHSDLYTDENPKGTIHGLKFATVDDAHASVAKIKSSGRSHAHKIQAAVAMEQRARAAGKASAAAVYRSYINGAKKTNESTEESCPHCNGPMFSEEMINEKKDACYYKVKSRYKVWPSAYASGALVQCRKKGASNWGTKSESSILEGLEQTDEDLHKWFKEKWVRFGPDGKIRGACARGGDSEGKPKCLPQSKAQNLGKKGRASAASRKRRQDPDPERSGKAINVATKKKTTESSILQGIRETKGLPMPGSYEQEYGPFKNKGGYRIMTLTSEQEELEEKWSNKYKRSIDCSHPKGFSQRAHCQGKKKK
jgi:GNAT superfamily N-acetyltransferase